VVMITNTHNLFFLGHELLPTPYVAAQDTLAGFIPPIKYAVCKNGCKLFNDTQNITRRYRCPTCNIHVYNTSLQPRRTMNMLPLTQQLMLLVYKANTRQDLLYRANYLPDDSYDSIFSGSLYQAQKHRLFRNIYDIAIGLYVDGFTAPNKSSHSLTMINVVVYNYRPSIR
jgi:hypothetical protein